MTDRCRIALETSATEADKEFVRESLRKFNQSRIGYRDYQELNLFLRDDAGRIVGGLLAGTMWNWLLIDYLWLDAAVRGQRYGSALIEQAEAEAIRRGCRFSCLDTVSFQAPGFYQKHGYQVVGEMQDFPAGHTRYFLSKTLSAQTA